MERFPVYVVKWQKQSTEQYVDCAPLLEKKK